ncbi:MAG: RnfABCDGE type electron transport complex subunit G [Ruminococcaceae bacterium]|nr:RnfABCDGE type electron transport complex subunit G [Oscillospiraceae bacterium]
MVKNIVKLGLVLFLICGISTGLLSFVNSLTAPVILENAKNQELLANKEVLPEASEFSIVAEDISEGKDNLGNVVGYAVKVSPNGYGGKINMIVGVKCDYTVSGVEILSMSETPGLGAKAQDKAFLNQFVKKDKSMKLKEDITAISGATITSTAVTEGVKEAILKIEKAGGKI